MGVSIAAFFFVSKYKPISHKAPAFGRREKFLF